MAHLAPTIGAFIICLGIITFGVLSCVEFMGHHFLPAGAYAVTYTIAMGVATIYWIIIALVPLYDETEKKKTSIMRMALQSRNSNYRIEVWSFYAWFIYAMLVTIVMLWVFVGHYGWNPTIDFSDPPGDPLLIDRWNNIQFFVGITHLVLATACVEAIRTFMILLYVKLIKSKYDLSRLRVSRHGGFEMQEVSSASSKKPKRATYLYIF